jgi:hypothetical protein
VGSESLPVTIGLPAAFGKGGGADLEGAGPDLRHMYRARVAETMARRGGLTWLPAPLQGGAAPLGL